jgi:outer membrane immunogenic protein
MKKLPLALTTLAAFAGSASAADLPVRTYTKEAPPAVVAPNWTGFYVFGGAGGGIWDAENGAERSGFLSGTPVGRDQHVGGHGAFGTVGAGYDWQLGGSWVTGVFADGMFGSLKGSITDSINFNELEGTEKLRDTWAIGARAGYLVAPNVLSYVNAGYTRSNWSGASLTDFFGWTAGGDASTTPSFHRDGFFVGGGVENSLNIFGISAPGWNMKTEYRAAYFGRSSLPESFDDGFLGSTITFKPWVQTISTSLVYRFNQDGPGSALAADLPARSYTRPPSAVAPNWTGFYVFGGVGGGIWDAANGATDNFGDIGRDQHMGGHGAFGTVGAGYDWQLGGSWVTGVFADGMFGSIKGSIADPLTLSEIEIEGTEKLRNTWAIGARAGYLVAPNVLSYVNAGYTRSNWSGASLTDFGRTGGDNATTPSFHRDGFFVGGGVENSLNIFGISAPGWNMKTEYRAAYFGRSSLPESLVVDGSPGETLTFKPLVQTISTSLVYRFNSEATTKY